jgi:hypothetical protein
VAAGWGERGWGLGFVSIYTWIHGPARLVGWANLCLDGLLSCLNGPSSCLNGSHFRVVFVLALRAEIVAQTRPIIVSCRH